MRILAILLSLPIAALALPAAGQALAQIAKQQGCTAAPIVVDGTDLYKCQTPSGLSYFSGPPVGPPAANGTARKATSSAKTATPANFPRVEGGVQRERDDVRKRVLTEELATEVRLMVESEVILKSGSSPMPDESPSSPKFLDRTAKLKQNVESHSRNIQALNKELERLR
ncbi:MAG: hypothetical protein ABI831_03040 [Betaproteobacteria bacterium]